MTKTLTTYEAVTEFGKKLKTLTSLKALLEWDQETKMPSGGVEFRSNQLEMLSGLIHEKLTSSELNNLLSPLIDMDSGDLVDSDSLDLSQKAALREWRKDVLKAKKLPDRLVKEFSKTTPLAIHAWAKAKEENSFEIFAPHLEKIIDLSKEKAQHLGYEFSPYDALLDEYEPKMTSQKLTKLFSEIKPKLLDLVKTHSKKIDSSFLYGDFDAQKLMSFNKELLDKMGLNKDFYRLDLSNHPFCLSMHPRDVRLTTHINSSDLVAGNISAVIHEAGHALYEMGLPIEHFGTPLCEALSMGIHESQSKFWETMIGQSFEFWEHFFPTLQKLFPENLKDISLDEFYKAINIVKPSFIRIHADEITYNLHVILRFEIEKALLSDELKVSEIPEAWNDKMQSYLGIVPKTFSEGCLQDIHWSCGLFGYFPTYLLGNLYAGQLYHNFRKTHLDYNTKIAQGNLLFIRDYLKKNVHEFGRYYSQEELIKNATGETLNPEYFIQYLDSKYSTL